MAAVPSVPMRCQGTAARTSDASFDAVQHARQRFLILLVIAAPGQFQMHLLVDAAWRHAMPDEFGERCAAVRSVRQALAIAGEKRARLVVSEALLNQPLRLAF